jgi:hypothetical protein
VGDYKGAEILGTYGFKSLDEEPFLSGDISLEGGLRIVKVSSKVSQYHVQSNLENINALSCDMTKEFIFFFEMSAKHLCRLINSMFDFYGDACTSLGFLDDLRQIRKQYHYQDGMLTSNDLWLISKDVLYRIMSGGTQEA